MPNRVIRESILTSDRVNMLDDAGEVFYRRLLNTVDDYGRYPARPVLLLAACYPLRRDMPASAIETALRACVDADLVVTYMVGRNKFLQVRDFRQHLRAMKSRYPPPPGEVDPPGPPPAVKPPKPDPAPPPQYGDNPQPPPRKRPRAINPSLVTLEDLTADGLLPSMAVDWLAHRKGRKAPLTHSAWDGIKKEADKAGWTLSDACQLAMVRGWTGFSSEWLDRAQRFKQPDTGETAYHRERRERMEEFVPPRKPAQVIPQQEVIDVIAKGN